MTLRRADVVIVGSGFGGSLLAMIARRLGRSVLLLERGRHPRFAIGESSTPLANLLLEELARRFDLPQVLPLTKWGSWQEEYPQVACGLKRGFTFLHHQIDEPFRADASRVDQLLVGASPREDVADTHWYRPDFDHLLVREAQRLGAEYLDDVALDRVAIGEDDVSLEGHRNGQALSVSGRLLLDATGPRGFLHRALGLGEAPFQLLPPTQALYSHFTNVRGIGRLVAPPPGDEPPYPPDQAAVHHVFPGGWIWVLQFNNGITSAGISATDRLASELRLDEGQPAWDRLLRRFPSIGEQFADAAPTRDFASSPRLAFRSATVTGPGWALLPHAAGFVDPLLSSGFPLTLLGVARLATVIEQLDRPGLGGALESYGAHTMSELATTERLVAALFATMHDPELFTALSLVYFAAASYVEAARRLGRRELSGTYLLDDHPVFGARARDCFTRALRAPSEKDRAALMHDIGRAIEPVDIAGFGRADRRNWYPADPTDTLNGAAKLHSNRDEVTAMLARCGIKVAR